MILKDNTCSTSLFSFFFLPITDLPPLSHYSKLQSAKLAIQSGLCLSYLCSNLFVQYINNSHKPALSDM